jgi:hypothetical protein
MFMVDGGYSNGSPSPAKQLEDQRDDCQHQQNMYEPAQRVAAYDSQQPQDEQNDKKRPQHESLPPYLDI